MTDHTHPPAVRIMAVDLISRMSAIQACQIGPSDEWSRSTKSGYAQAATDCAFNILKIQAAIEPAPDPRDAVIARLEADLAESNRRRDGWKEKAEGYDALAAAVRAKIGTDNRVSMSRVVLTGALYEAESRVKARDAVIAQLVGALGALQPGDTPCKPACGNHGGYNCCTCGMESKRQGLFDALAAAKAVMP